MKIKTKVTIGILLLSILIIAQGIIFNIYIYKYSEASEEILKDNYRTVGYCREMASALDDIHQYVILSAIQKESDSDLKLDETNLKNAKNAIVDFENNLKAEENNITEPGEKEVVLSLQKKYDSYILEIKNALPGGGINVASLSHLTILNGLIRSDIKMVMNINMNAITKKNKQAYDVSHHAILYTSGLEILALFITLPILFLFPSYIARPIQEIKEKIREVKRKNYSQKIIIRRNDELGELAEEFNELTDQLQEQQRHKTI